jgi:hypothetical protein
VTRADEYNRLLLAAQRAAGKQWTKNATLVAMQKRAGKLLQRVPSCAGWQNPTLDLERVVRGFRAIPRRCSAFFHEGLASEYGVPARASDKNIFMLGRGGFWDSYVSVLTLGPTSKWKSHTNPITMVLAPGASSGVLCNGSARALPDNLTLQAKGTVDRFDVLLNVKQHLDDSLLLAALALGVILDTKCGDQSLHPELHRHPCRNASSAVAHADAPAKAAHGSHAGKTQGLSLKDHTCDDDVLAHANHRLVSMAAVVRQACVELAGLDANDTQGCVSALIAPPPAP